MITSLFASGYSCTPIYPGKHCAYLGKLLNKQDNRFLTWIKCILIRTIISSSRLALRPLPCCVHWYKTTMSQTSFSPNKQCLERSVLNYFSPSPQASWKPFKFFSLWGPLSLVFFLSGLFCLNFSRTIPSHLWRLKSKHSSPISTLQVATKLLPSKVTLSQWQSIEINEVI